MSIHLSGRSSRGRVIPGSAAPIDSEKPECYRRANLRGSPQNPVFHRDLQTVLNNQVLVLNRLWQAVNICSARRAFALVYAGHGVAGSQLVDGPPSGDELWLGPLSDRRRLNLFVNGNPPPSPNIKAVDILRTTLGQPVYGPLLDFLTSTGGYREYQLNGDPSTCDISQINPDPNLNPNLFEFVYDWRKELGATAQSLRTFVQCVEQFHPGSKINILTHSMGSLLARRYILDNPTDHNVDRLITIGAPWLGAPKLLYALESGEFIRVHGIPIAAGPDIKYIMLKIVLPPVERHEKKQRRRKR